MNTDDDYLCEELMDEVRRGDVPIYQALLNLHELRRTGLITRDQGVKYKKQLALLAAQQMDKE